jgi:ubiquinone/menaquinone biosynthesis C-methylase UbiE
MKRACNYYDDPQFDYEAYWAKRGYEDQAERIALKRLLKQIPSEKKNRLLDIGAGYGRFCSIYGSDFNQCCLVDPSERLLEEAKEISFSNLSFEKASVEKLPFEDESFDVALLIRVAHHLQNFSVAVEEIWRILQPEGYFILEFPNKTHLKGRLLSIFGLRDVFFDLSPIDLRTKQEIRMKVAPFYNYHPYWMRKTLEKKGWEIVKKLSVSNFRHPLFKSLLSDKLLLYLENLVQVPFACFNLGPSIFLLLKKPQN